MRSRQGTTTKLTIKTTTTMITTTTTTTTTTKTTAATTTSTTTTKTERNQNLKTGDGRLEVLLAGRSRVTSRRRTARRLEADGHDLPPAVSPLQYNLSVSSFPYNLYSHPIYISSLPSNLNLPSPSTVLNIEDIL